MRYEHSDGEWDVIRPMLANKARGIPRVDDRRILNGIFWILRSGAPWRDLPDSYGPPASAVAGRSRLRRGLDQGICHRTGRVGEYPTQAQPQRPDLLQSLPLPRP